MNKKLIISKINDPAYNLALEEFLIREKEEVLYLWQNKDTVVIGRNQNPYKECNLKEMKVNGIRLVRRRSGGGAVFHDLGNLNFTIISKLNENNIEYNFKFINKVLRKLDIEAVFNGRNDLLVNGKKISGNAFFEEEDIFCHHGTLMIDVDTKKLGKYLTPSNLKLKTNAINSVKSRVVNINRINPGVDVKALIKAFEDEYDNSGVEEEYYHYDFCKNKDIMKIVEKYNSWEWTYGQAPNTNIDLEEKFSWGIIEIGFFVENGFINGVNIFTDSILNEGFKELEGSLIGAEFKLGSILDGINRNIKNEIVRNDIISLIDKI